MHHHADVRLAALGIAFLKKSTPGTEHARKTSAEPHGKTGSASITWFALPAETLANGTVSHPQVAAITEMVRKITEPHSVARSMEVNLPARPGEMQNAQERKKLS